MTPSILLVLALGATKPPQAPLPPQAPIARPVPACPMEVVNCYCGCREGKGCICPPPPSAKSCCCSAAPDKDGWFYSKEHGKVIRYVWTYSDGSTVPCKPGETCAPPKVGTTSIKEAPPVLPQVVYPPPYVDNPPPMFFGGGFRGGFSGGGSCSGGG